MRRCRGETGLDRRDPRSETLELELRNQKLHAPKGLESERQRPGPVPERHVVAEPRELLVETHLISALGDGAPHVLRNDLIDVIEEVRNVVELLYELRGGARANAAHPGKLSDTSPTSAAHDGSCSGRTPNRSMTLASSYNTAFLATRTGEHDLHRVAGELQKIAVAADDERRSSRVAQCSRKRGKDVVPFEPRHAEHGQLRHPKSWSSRPSCWRTASGVASRVALYASYRSWRNVFCGASTANASPIGFCSRTTFRNNDEKP